MCEISSLSRNKREMHQIPPSATREYIIRAAIASCPPKRNATISNWKSPIAPQLSAPTIARRSESLSSICFNSEFSIDLTEGNPVNTIVYKMLVNIPQREM